LLNSYVNNARATWLADARWLLLNITERFDHRRPALPPFEPCLFAQQLRKQCKIELKEVRFLRECRVIVSNWFVIAPSRRGFIAIARTVETFDYGEIPAELLASDWRSDHAVRDEI
jgi:hypothetical protein